MRLLARPSRASHLLAPLRAGRWTCPHCSDRLASRILSAPVARNGLRDFSAYTRSLRKKNRGASEEEEEDGTTGTEEDIDIFDFSALEAGILKVHARLTRNLSELRAGGFNPKNLETLQVSLPKAGGNAKLGDLAQVVARGRTVSVIVGEEELVQSVSRAILASSHSFNPQGPTASAPTTLTIQLPPATGESRQAALDEVQKFAGQGALAIKEQRLKQHKQLKKTERDKRARPDDLQKAHKMMEEVIKKGKDEVQRIADGARKVLKG